jgi:hypothetical protein
MPRAPEISGRHAQQHVVNYRRAPAAGQARSATAPRATRGDLPVAVTIETLTRALEREGRRL